MIIHATVQALGQARLADLHDQARRHATHRATALQAALTQARVPRRKTPVGTPGRVMRDG